MKVGEPDMTGMQELAEVMVRAGCEAVVGMLKDGHAVLAVGDGMDPRELVHVLREYADAIERLDEDKDLIGKVTVEYDDEEEK